MKKVTKHLVQHFKIISIFKCSFHYYLQLQQLFTKMFWGGPEYNEGQQVIPRQGTIGSVWISGYDFAHSINKLKDRNIYGVLSAVDLSFKYPEGFEQLTFKLEDNQNQKVTHCFEEAYEFIEKQRLKTNVLVHCAAGISRCSTILISYLMRKYGISYEEAYKMIKTKRSCIQPNSGFEKQLRLFEADCLKK